MCARHLRLLVALATLGAAAHSAAQEQVSHEPVASIIDYQSLCSFNDPPAWPPTSGWQLKAVTRIDLSDDSCSKLEEQYGHPAAVAIRLVNSSAVDWEIPLDLASVSIRRSDGTASHPIAYRWLTKRMALGKGFLLMTGLPAGNTMAAASPQGQTVHIWSTNLQGTWGLKLAPYAAVDLVFAFEEAAAGDTVSIGGLGPILVR